MQKHCVICNPPKFKFKSGYVCTEHTDRRIREGFYRVKNNLLEGPFDNVGKDQDQGVYAGEEPPEEVPAAPETAPAAPDPDGEGWNGKIGGHTGDSDMDSAGPNDEMNAQPKTNTPPNNKTPRKKPASTRRRSGRGRNSTNRRSTRGRRSSTQKTSGGWKQSASNAFGKLKNFFKGFGGKKSNRSSGGRGGRSYDGGAGNTGGGWRGGRVNPDGYNYGVPPANTSSGAQNQAAAAPANTGNAPTPTPEKEDADMLKIIQLMQQAQKDPKNMSNILKKADQMLHSKMGSNKGKAPVKPKTSKQQPPATPEPAPAASAAAPAAAAEPTAPAAPASSNQQPAAPASNNAGNPVSTQAPAAPQGNPPAAPPAAPNNAAKPAAAPQFQRPGWYQQGKKSKGSTIDAEIKNVNKDLQRYEGKAGDPKADEAIKRLETYMKELMAAKQNQKAGGPPPKFTEW